MSTERKKLVFRALSILMILVSCSNTTTSASSTTTTATTPSTMPTTTPAPATTLEPTTTPSMTIAPAVTKSPSTTIRKTTPSTYPQIQLTGTPEEQLTQVVAAAAKVAAVKDYGSWVTKLYQLKQSVASYGITIDADPGTGVYTISMGGQRACFLWTLYDKLEPHSC